MPYKYADSLYSSTNSLAKLISNLAEEEFEQTGLTPSYAILLMVVSDNPGIQPGNLSKLMNLTPSTITRLIEKLEYKGLLERRVSGKYTNVYPAKLSNQLDFKIRKAWAQLQKRYSVLLGVDLNKEMTELTNKAIGKLKR